MAIIAKVRRDENTGGVLASDVDEHVEAIGLSVSRLD
jgi:hypothetical protein